MAIPDLGSATERIERAAEGALRAADRARFIVDSYAFDPVNDLEAFERAVEECAEHCSTVRAETSRAVARRANSG